MKLQTIILRLLVPAPLITLYYLLRFSARISTRAEVELSSNIRIGRGTQVSSFTKIKASLGEINIGSKVDIATGAFISGPVRIGDHSLIGPNVNIVANNYRYDRIDIPIHSQGHTVKGIEIGRDVWIGAGSCIVDGVHIGNGVIVGPNSVVTTDLPENAIVQGNPAKVIFTRR